MLLDPQDLSKLVKDAPDVIRLVRSAQSHDLLVAVSNLTLLEAWNPRGRLDRFRWQVSKLEVLPVTETISWRALDLLRDAGLHGHKYAIDSVVAATALGYAGPRVIVTSDVDDMVKLCGKRAAIAQV
ncbi:PIN domain-containing protein [Streptomyces laurentii]|uniref:DNA-binding protein n=1 Tax=Streptomyces laurentii TaxID=39478 RepID=UPI00368C52E9